MKKYFGTCVLALCVCNTFGLSATLHVGSGQSYSTIQEAYTVASAGDTIVIHEGVYTSFADLSANDGKNNITFTRSGTDKVVIDLPSNIYLRYKTGTTFDGLIFDGSGLAQTIYLRYSPHSTRFYNCVFYNPNGHGVYAYGANGWIGNLVFDNNTFYTNSGSALYGNNQVQLQVVKDNLFVSNGTGANGVSLTETTQVEYSAFWVNTTNVSGMVNIGTGSITNTQPIFVSTDINNPYFMYLDRSNSSKILNGASDGEYIGARGTISCDPTILGDIAGSKGLGDIDCAVNLYDFAAMTLLWLECTDPQDNTCMGGNTTVINVKEDLVKWRIFARDAQGDGVTDDSMPIQAAIDFLTAKGGGTVYVPAGTYIASGLTLADNVTLDGEGIDQTVFRAAATEVGITLTGSNAIIRDFTYYGSKAENSNSNWDPNTNIGVLASHNIATTGAVNCEFRNIKSLECRYDNLYLRDANGLTIYNCHFNRAGRNIVSIVNSQNWSVNDSYIGNLWKLYHVDMENNVETDITENGVFYNCTFDGVNRGSITGTSIYENAIQYISHTGVLRNITVQNSAMNQIIFRVEDSTVIGCSFIGNAIETAGSAVFYSVDLDGGLDNATISSNTFRSNGNPATQLTSGVTIINSVITNNDPSTWDN